MFMAFHISCLDITLNSVWTQNFEVVMSSCKEVNEIRVGDNACWAIAFCHPLCNVCTDLNE